MDLKYYKIYYIVVVFTFLKVKTSNKVSIGMSPTENCCEKRVFLSQKMKNLMWRSDFIQRRFISSTKVKRIKKKRKDVKQNYNLETQTGDSRQMIESYSFYHQASKIKKLF